MDELVDTLTWQYAVISVRSEPDRERLVIAYPDEETLRGLIAATSIVALGYTSRADAIKNIDRCVKTKTSFKRLLTPAALKTNITFLTECCVTLRRLASGFRLSGNSKIVRNFLHNGLAGLSSSTRKMYWPGRFEPLSLFRIIGHQHQER